MTLKKYLAKQRLTQQEFAELLGHTSGVVVTQSQVSLWASGATRPNKTTRHLIEVATNGAVSAKRGWCRGAHFCSSSPRDTPRRV